MRISVIAGATAWPLAAHAQRPMMPVIGWLLPVPLGPLVDAMTQAFRRGMAELGYVDGKNNATETRFNPESLPQAAADLER
jgi:putative ABC transport system substrate-binding protein